MRLYPFFYAAALALASNAIAPCSPAKAGDLQADRQDIATDKSDIQTDRQTLATDRATRNVDASQLGTAEQTRNQEFQQLRKDEAAGNTSAVSSDRTQLHADQAVVNQDRSQLRQAQGQVDAERKDLAHDEFDLGRDRADLHRSQGTFSKFTNDQASNHWDSSANRPRSSSGDLPTAKHASYRDHPDRRSDLQNRREFHADLPNYHRGRMTGGAARQRTP